MAEVSVIAAKLEAWLNDAALPLWTGVGVDNATGTVWEALDHFGKPLVQMQKRLRVQARQAYCFALSDHASHKDLALQLFRFAMDKGFDAETGLLASRLAPDASIAVVTHDLYDLAFMLLAASALIDAGFDVESDLERLEAELSKLKAPRGWHENARRSLPRRQNPHMHLFEATTALYDATGDPRFRDMAEECLELFSDFFLSSEGLVLEFFNKDWTPVDSSDQLIEPGHMMEWVFLIHQFEQATGMNTRLPIERPFTAALDRRDASGLLPDVSDPQSGTRRTWPQTEFLKAALVMRDRGDIRTNCPNPETVLTLLWEQYLDTPAGGGWYDRRDADGNLLSDNMPASTFYHIFVAFKLYIDMEKS